VALILKQVMKSKAYRLIQFIKVMYAFGILVRTSSMPVKAFTSGLMKLQMEMPSLSLTQQLKFRVDMWSLVQSKPRIR
jgi:hypothetical protein